MSKIYLADERTSDAKIGSLLEKFSTKVGVYAPGTCPVTVQHALLQAAMIQKDGMPPDDMTVLCARVAQRHPERRHREAI